MIVVSEYGNKFLLDRFIGGGVSDLTLRLFTNDIELKRNLRSIDFKEAFDFGYIPLKLYSDLYKINNNGLKIEEQFTFTGNLGNVYGYFITDHLNEWIWAEKFDKIYEVKVNGDIIKIVCNIKIKVKEK